MNKQFDQFNDEELLDQLKQEQNSEIVEYLLEKYKNLVRSKANSLYMLGADNEDLIQEGMIGLLKAVRTFDIGRDASFATFANLCVTRQMYTAVQNADRKKHSPLNYYVSLNASPSEKAGEEVEPLLDILDLKEMSPEEYLIDLENVQYIEGVIDSELSDFEKQVLELYLTGLSYREIANVLGREAKATDNALNRIKAKLKKALKNQ